MSICINPCTNRHHLKKVKTSCRSDSDKNTRFVNGEGGCRSIGYDGNYRRARGGDRKR